MSRAGEQAAEQIGKLRNYMEAQAEQVKGSKGSKGAKSVEFMQGVLDVLEDFNMRMQVLEQEFGPSDAFVNPNDGTHRIK